ncbi:hypothetical protein E4U42_004028 [Claviceps africana]|uniref:Uncharacterized protein n=1 Tax=Claviceps africana TaxID=83212 RepID=A0A8K0NHB6_9HYPO|nr:hypothetical protein E4U42_004028 [Claviceps africana]
MSKSGRALDTRRLEIILLAIAVFVLVALLAILILVCVTLKHSHSLPPANHTDTPDGTAWGGSWSERWDAGPLSPYQDDEEFFHHVPGRSGTTTEDVTRGRTSFKDLAPLLPDAENAIHQTLTETADTFEALPDVGGQACECNMNPDGYNRDVSESSASSTAREQTLGTTTRRLERAVSHDNFDLEAHDPEY